MNKSSKQTVLLVEDDTFLSGMYITKLEAAGYQVLLATDGESGLSLARESKPDIILLDILLPKLDGLEVLTTLKRDSGLRTIPVIMLTNLGEQKDISRANALGAADYLVKAHYLPSEVIDTIGTHLKPHGH